MKIYSVTKFLRKASFILLLMAVTIVTGLSQSTLPQPMVLQAVAPIYPVVAASARVSRTMTVEVKINTEGKVTSTRIVEGNRLLDKAAENAARRWIFVAVNEESVRSARLTFTFKLMPEDAPADELLPIFMPPYHIEVRRAMPKVIDNPNIDPPLSKQPLRPSRKKP